MASDDFNQFLIAFSHFDCFHENIDSQMNQKILKQLKVYRENHDWENKEMHDSIYETFCKYFIYYTINRNVGLPDLQEIFHREEIDCLLTKATEYNYTTFVRFVIRTGYKDEPELDKDGKPLPSRTTPVNVSLRFKTQSRDILIRDLFRIYNRFDVNYTDESGVSHFHVACMAGCLYIVKKLFKLVRDPNFPVQETGDSPLHLALRYYQKKVAEWLLRKGANPTLVNSMGLTPLHVICGRIDDVDLAERLFKFANDKHQPININAQDKFGDTSLHMALRRGRDKVAEWLLRKGADPNVANVQGLTPLHVICKRNKDDGLLEKFFKTNNEKHKVLQVDALDKLGRTPLQWAVTRFLPRAVESLMNNGADISCFVFPTESHFDEGLTKEETKGWYSLKLTVASGSLAVVECLENGGYELTRSDALTIMKLFAKYGLFNELSYVFQDLPNDEFYSSTAKRTMVIPSLSLYDLTRLRPKDASKLLTYQDYLDLSRTRLLRKFCQYHEDFQLHLCEKLSRGFFRVWALECFMELTQCRMPIECCEIIIDESFPNKNSYDICLAATGQSL
uniref:Uncharacterized protein n=1 Tax=Trichogramma kaykai TaxID=54128 RepID=A0ABD2X8U9_9HYME